MRPPRALPIDSSTVNNALKPTRRPADWAIIAFYIVGLLLVAYSSHQWVTSSSDDLNDWTSGRTIALPGWLWIALGYVLGIAVLGFASWAERWRRRLK